MYTPHRMSPFAIQLPSTLLAQNGPPNTSTSDASNIAILLFLFSLTLLLAAAFLLWRRARHRRHHAGTADPACGHCGYLVKGLSTFTCPECGSDLREVGITRRPTVGPAGARRSPRSGAAVFLQTVGWKLAFTAGVVAGTAGIAINYYDDYLRPHTRFETQTIHGFPHSGAFTAVTVTFGRRETTRGNPRFSHGPPDVSQVRVTVELQTGPDRFLFVRDVLAGTNTFLVDGLERTTRAPLGQEFRDWMRDHGVNVNDPRVSAEVLTIANAIGQADKQGEFFNLMANDARQHFNIDRVSLDGKAEGQTAFYAAATATTLAVGLAALAVVWFRNRRRLATALAARLADARGSSQIAQGAPIPSAPASPSSAPTVRTLTVMFSDVKDYTARTAAESRLGVLDLVRRHRELVQPVATRRGGRIVKSLGDGLLLTFDSATDAVLAGLEIQSAAAAHNATAQADRDKLELRIAVSTGEVTLHDDDVFGEPVNLASRAQQHATPGEVLFTDPTKSTINRREIQFTSAGTHHLKGLEDPVPLYRALPPPTPKPTKPACPLQWGMSPPHDVPQHL